MAWLDRIPLPLLLVIALWLGLAPFTPEPHLWQKGKMLFSGTLGKPIDIFDLVMHAAAPILLLLKIVRVFRKRA